MFSPARKAQLAKDRDWLEKHIAGHDLDVLAWRRVAQSFGQSALSILNMGGGRGHPKAKASLLLRGSDLEKAPEGMASELSSELTTFKQSVVDLEGQFDTVGRTVIGQVVEITKRLFELVDSADSALDRLQFRVQQASTWKSSKAANRAAEKKRMSFKMGQFLKAFEKGGTPSQLARSLVSLGFFPAPSGADEFADWPVHIERSALYIAAGASEGALARAETWEMPVCFQLDEGLPAGTVGARTVEFVFLSESPMGSKVSSP